MSRTHRDGTIERGGETDAGTEVRDDDKERYRGGGGGGLHRRPGGAGGPSKNDGRKRKTTQKITHRRAGGTLDGEGEHHADGYQVVLGLRAAGDELRVEVRRDILVEDLTFTHDMFLLRIIGLKPGRGAMRLRTEYDVCE
jgi:hypothetical protein